MVTPLALPCFVATRREDVPVGLVRYVSVDGSVPGAAVTWDHHVTGECINLDAMPETFDACGFDGVGTTLADLDAAASAVAVAGSTWPRAVGLPAAAGSTRRSGTASSAFALS